MVRLWSFWRYQPIWSSLPQLIIHYFIDNFFFLIYFIDNWVNCKLYMILLLLWWQSYYLKLKVSFMKLPCIFLWPTTFFNKFTQQSMKWKIIHVNNFCSSLPAKKISLPIYLTFLIFWSFYMRMNRKYINWKGKT